MKRALVLVFSFVATFSFLVIQGESQPVEAAGGFVSLSSPARFLNTRESGLKIGDPSLAGSGDYVLQVAGLLGVPAGVSAVAMNLTVTETEANDYGGYASVYPCGPVPDASNLNFVSGQTIANSVVAPLNGSGQLCISVYGYAHVLVDISGYFVSGFESLTPARFLDTRESGVKIGDSSLDGSGDAYTLQVTGGDVPASATAVAMNLTVTETEANDYGGYASVYPCGPVPDASNLNFVSGQTIANSVVAPLNGSGQLCISVYGYAHVLVDISGYLSDSASDSGSGGSSGDSGSGGSSGGGTTTLNPTELTFDLEGAAGVALSENQMTRTLRYRDAGGKLQSFSTSSNLLAVDADGGTRPATQTGVADISRLLVAPNDKVYVLFNQRVNLRDTSLECSHYSESSWLPSYSEYSFRWVSYDWEGADPPGYWEQSSEQVTVTEGWYAYVEYQVVYPDGSSPDWDWTNWRYVPCEEPPCLLGEIDPLSGIVSCIDNTLESIAWDSGWNNTGNPAIQFDDEGNIYYHGYGTDDDGIAWAGILRQYRVSDGTVTDLVTDNVSISDFLVTGDGSIYLSGQTNSTNDDWFRLLTPIAGQERPRTSTVSSQAVEWMYEFPDGNVYYAGNCCSDGWESVKAYDASARQSTTWIWNSIPSDLEASWQRSVSGTYDYDSDVCFNTSTPYEDEDGDGFCGGYTYYGSYTGYDYTDIPVRTWVGTEGCYVEQPITRSTYIYPGYDSSGNWAQATYSQTVVPNETYRQRSNSMFCSSPNQLRQRLHSTIEGNVYGVTGYSWGSDNPTSIAMYYPTPRLFDTDVVNATTVLPVLDKMFLTGVDSSGNYLTTYLDLSSNQEIDLIPSSEELEVYRLSFLSTRNRLMFDGYRFQDSSYVIGYVDMQSGQVVASRTGGQRLVDFQLFS